MKKQIGLTVLWLVLGIVVGAYSLVLVLAQLRGHQHHPLIVLGLAELAAATLFLIPKTLRVGGIALIAIFALAALFHLVHGEYDIGFLAVYAAGAFAVVSLRS